jgi:diadenosine tetraphosphate (Ap4A) HIT family hydrolase
MNCEICELAEQSRSRVMEGVYWNVIVSRDQLYLGRCMVVLKRHCPTLSDLTLHEVADWHEIVRKLEYALLKTFEPNLFNWACLMNDAYKSAHPDPHVHWHVRPRYSEPVNFSGKIFTDPDFAHHYGRGHLAVPATLTNKIARAIGKSLP